MKKNCNLNKFTTLLEKDFYRNLKIILSIISLFFIGHIGMAWLRISAMAAQAEDALQWNEVEELLFRDKISFTNLLHSKEVIFIMGLSMLAVILYTLFLWNNEWTSSNKTIYTLLTMPIKRTYIILSKVFTIGIFLGFNLLVQIGALFIDNWLISFTMPKSLIVEEKVLEVFAVNNSTTIFNLLSRDIYLSIIITLTLVLLLTLIILLFRSFKIKGIIFGVILLVSCLGIPIGVCSKYDLFSDESFIFILIYSLISSILSFLYVRYLLENKVQV